MKGSAWKRYCIAAAIGTGLFLILMFTRNGFSDQESLSDRWHILCDALFVPGALLVSFGLLLFAAGGGVFDMLKFGVTKAYSVIMTKKKRESLPRTFFDYKMEREAKGKVKTGYLLVVGAVFLLLAALALLMYNQYDPFM